jgi:uncharacterized membrane protein
MLVFTFFSSLTSPINGAVSGFLGEFLYQLAYYDKVHFQWLIIIPTIGFLSGLYKYYPQKYLEKKNLILSILKFFIISLVISFLIFVLTLLLNPLFELDALLINFSIKFIVQSLITIVLIVPLLLFLYDFILAKQERHIYHLFLTHHPIYASDHTFYLRFGRSYFYFCSRCSGVIIGGLLTSFISYIIIRIIGPVISPELAVLICIMIPIPGIIDWVTQRLLYRKSNTVLRLFTGFLIGMGLFFLSYTDQYYGYMLFLIIFYFSIVGLAMYIGQKKQIKRIEEENNHMPTLEDEYDE